MTLLRLIKMCLNETYCRTRAGKCLSDMFAIRNSVNQGDALSPLLFNFVLECAIKRVQANQEALNKIVHVSFWFMLMMLIYWVEAYIL